jgi:uncharacterized membrane protein
VIVKKTDLRNNRSMRLRPIHAVLIVLALVAGGVVANFAFENGFHGVRFTRVSPDANGTVRINVAAIGPDQVRFYRFLNAGNQEVKFFIARDHNGDLHVAFNASESHARVGRGFRQDGEWVIDNKCDTPTRITEIGAGHGGCSPVPLAYRAEGTTIVLAEDQILRGWRLFN